MWLTGQVRFDLFTDRRSWQSARDQCKAKGGKLALPHNSTENAQMYNMMKDRGSSWIGVNDLSVRTAEQKTKQINLIHGFQSRKNNFLCWFVRKKTHGLILRIKHYHTKDGLVENQTTSVREFFLEFFFTRRLSCPCRLWQN